jgi:hypothetical protein
LHLVTGNLSRLAITGTGAATFSSNVTANNYVEIIGNLILNSTSADRKIYFRGSGATPDTNWSMGTLLTPTGATVVTAAATVIDVYNGAGYGFMVRNTSNAPLLQILGSTGAATFSSSVTATSGNFTVDDAATNSVLDILTLTHTTSGTAASGLGAGILFRTERPSSGITLSRGAIYGVSGTDADDNGDLALYTLTNTGASGFSEKMRIKGNGSVGIGTISPNLTSANRTTVDINGANQSLLVFSNAGAFKGYIYNGGTDMDYTAVNQALFGAGTNVIINTAGSERMRITSGGNVGIGTTAPVRKMDIVATGEQLRLAYDSGGSTYTDFRNDSAGGLLINTSGNYIINYIAGSAKTRINSNGDFIVFNLGTGLVYSNGGALTSTNPSDERLKDNITDISWGLSDILKLRPVSYHWKDDKINQGVQFGFIAQEVQEVMPEAIKEFGADVKYLGLEKDAIYATLVKAIQELEARIKQLENK